MKDRVKVLISEEEIQKRLRELAAQIETDYNSENFVVIGVLKGAFIFMADLVRHFKRSVRCDFLRVSSYVKARSSGQLRLEFDLTQNVAGENVLLVEDIVDTGRTLEFLLKHLKLKNPKSIKVCTLLYKEINPRMKDLVDYQGFTVPNKFVVGYGLDYEGLYREIPFVGYVEGM